MTLPIRTFWEGLGHDLEGLSDDDLLEAGERLIKEFGTTSPGAPARQRVLDAIRGEAGGHTVDPRGRGDAPASPPCCEGEVYPGPSGVRRRHTCAGRKGEPWVDDQATAAKVAKVFDLASRRLPSGAVHPPCASAWATGEATPCWRCLPILCGALDCSHDACRYFLEHADDADDVRGSRWSS